jgi:hypothetical protein
LTSAPADPFLWLTLFWLSNTRNGFAPEHLRYLEMSYLLGPNEGWIALKRNRFTLSVASVVPGDLVEKSVSEFVSLVRSGFYEQASQALIGPGWSLRDTLLGRLRDVNEAARRDFARNLRDMGIDDVVVPEVEARGKRPWR